MGYISTLVSEDYGSELPNWFKEKYSKILHFTNNSTLIASKVGIKIHNNELFEDYRKALIEIEILDEYLTEVNVVVLSEDVIITRVTIGINEVKFILMKVFYETDSVS